MIVLNNLFRIGLVAFFFGKVFEGFGDLPHAIGNVTVLVIGPHGVVLVENHLLELLHALVVDGGVPNDVAVHLEQVVHHGLISQLVDNWRHRIKTAINNNQLRLIFEGPLAQFWIIRLKFAKKNFQIFTLTLKPFNFA